MKRTRVWWATRLVLVAGLGATGAGAGEARPLAAQVRDLLLVGGRLVDGTAAPARDNGWVHVRGGRIAGAGQGAPPSVDGARVIQLAGRTLLPGLAEMHGHLGGIESARWMIKVLLAHGVTSVLDPANSLGNATAIRRWAASDSVVPHLYFATPPLQGSYSEQRFLQPGAEVERLVGEYAAFGVDFIKVYNWLSSAGMVQVGKLARERGIPVTGHTPLSWTSVGAIDAGNGMLQHLRLRPYEVIDDLELIAKYPVDGSLMKRTGFWAHLDPNGRNVAQTLKAWERRKEQFFLTPTLVVQEAVAESYDYPDPKFEGRAGLDLLSEGMRAQFRRRSPPVHWGRLSPGEIAEAKRALAGMATFVGLAHRRGIRILAGTDTPIPWLVPGESLHRELRYFVEMSGMTPEEAIRTATGNAADALRLTDRGRITVGQVADLIVVRGDVGRDIGALAAVELVILGGRLLTPESLLQEASDWARQDGMSAPSN